MTVKYAIYTINVVKVFFQSIRCVKMKMLILNTVDGC